MRRAKWGKLSKEDSRALFGLHTYLHTQREISLRHAQAPESCPVDLAGPRRLHLVPDGESLACQLLKYIRRTMRTHDGEHVPDHVQAVLQIRLRLGRPKDSACPAKGSATTKVSSFPLHPPDDGQPHIHILAYSYSVECDLDHSLTGLEDSGSAVYAIQVWYLMAFSG